MYRTSYDVIETRTFRTILTSIDKLQSDYDSRQPDLQYFSREFVFKAGIYLVQGADAFVYCEPMSPLMCALIIMCEIPFFYLSVRALVAAYYCLKMASEEELEQFLYLDINQKARWIHSNPIFDRVIKNSSKFEMYERDFGGWENVIILERIREMKSNEKNRAGYPHKLDTPEETQFIADFVLAKETRSEIFAKRVRKQAARSIERVGDSFNSIISTLKVVMDRKLIPRDVSGTK